MVDPVVENILATIGTLLWTIQLIPQIWKSYHTKSTQGLSAMLMFIWAISSGFTGSYLIVNRLSIPMIMQPQCFGLLSTISVGQCLYYSKGWKASSAVLFVVGFAAVMGGFEVGSVYALSLGQTHGTQVPALCYGYIGVALTAIAVIPQYYEIYRLREVKGISMTFMAVDVLGGLFTLTSLFFRVKLDIAAFVSPLLVVVLDSIIVLLAIILNPRARRRHDRESDRGHDQSDPAGIHYITEKVPVSASSSNPTSATCWMYFPDSEKKDEPSDLGIGMAYDASNKAQEDLEKGLAVIA